MIEPVFERLAHERTQAGGAGGNGGVAFVKIDLGAGMGGMVGSLYGVRVTPTFIFFRDGNKVSGNCVCASCKAKCSRSLVHVCADPRNERC